MNCNVSRKNPRKRHTNGIVNTSLYKSNPAVSRNYNSPHLFIPGPPDEVERIKKEGQRGGHAEDRHAEPAGRCQDRPWAARKGPG